MRAIFGVGMGKNKNEIGSHAWSWTCKTTVCLGEGYLNRYPRIFDGFGFKNVVKMGPM